MSDDPSFPPAQPTSQEPDRPSFLSYYLYEIILGVAGVLLVCIVLTLMHF